MQPLQKKLLQLKQSFTKATEVIGYEERLRQLQAVEIKSRAEDLWRDTVAAQQVMKELARLQSILQPWIRLNDDILEVEELLEMKDETLQHEIESQIQRMQTDFELLKEQMKFTSPFDDHDALLTLAAGAGGTDAQDWTQMLLRMYTRWAEKNGYKVVLVEESNGEEAGLKRATIEVSGEFVYGKLKGEHGVHRLVRLSPFNADSLRQTSFAKVEVLPKIDTPDELIIDPQELKIDVYRAGGHGGQSVNTTDSAVRVTHLPTGLTVSIQNERSQLQNKETALTILRSRLAKLQIDQHQEKLSQLKGPNQSAEWGNQIRSYVLHPYKQVKDIRTKHETSNAEAVLDGDLQPFIDSYLENTLSA